MRRIFFVMAAILFVAGLQPVSAQQNELAALRGEIAKQQVVIAQLLKRIEALEKPAAPAPASLQELQDDIKAQEDSVNSLRETINSKVNLNGYYNFRFSVDGSDEPMAFQQHHLGVLMAKQLGKFNFLMELELQNVPHHPEIVTGEEHEEEEEGEEHAETDISGEGQVAVENAWMEYNHNRLLSVRVGKQLSPQYWWQNHYPNLTLSTALPIYLRELFPAELVGVTVQGSVANPVGTSEFGVGYKFYVANNNFEGNSRTDRRDGKSWGARGQVRFPTSGMLRRLDVAADVYRGHVGLSNEGLAEDNVVGFETQLEFGQFLLQTEWARGKSLGHDAHRLLPAAGASARRRLDHVLPPGAARKPENPAGRAAAHGGRELPAVSADRAQGRAVSIAAARARLHSHGRRRGKQAVQRVRAGGGVFLLILT